MLILSLAVFVVGWSALWLFAWWEARLNLNNWLAAERGQGRLWDCPNRSVGGFPLSIRLTCDRPSFADAGNQAFRGELAGLRAEVKLYFPTSVGIDLVGPLRIQDSGIDAGLTVSWASARIELRGDLPGSLDRGQLEAEGVAIAATALQSPIAIQHGEMSFRPLPQKAAGPQDAEITIGAQGLRDADADATFGSAEPIEARLAGILSRLPTKGASLPTLLEAWREAGGRLDLSAFRFSKGPFEVAGAGWLQVDDEHRIEGRLDTRFVGLAPVAARFGLPIDAVKLGGLLSNLLGGKTDSDAQHKADIAMPLGARAGRLYLGPVKTGIALPPLY